MIPRPLAVYTTERLADHTKRPLTEIDGASCAAQS